MRLLPNSRLGSYDIVSPLGVGGMGEVYRARDPRLRREVAIKVLPADVASEPERLARFEREARTIAALNHPNIVTLFSLEDDGGVRFLTMELVEGDTLDQFLTPGGLPAARLLEIAIPLASALAAAHGRGVTHRDLKPANVMLARDGLLKVLDFGLAKLAAEPSALDTALPASVVGQVVGTLPYMAPEQVRGESADARTDLFAFGAVLYELAAGRRPFTGGSAIALAVAILSDAPVPLPTLRPDLPTDLHVIVHRCLEKEPAQRFQSAVDVATALRGVERAMLSGGPAARRTEAPGTSAAPDDVTVPAPGRSTVPSIAVLPFVSRSADEADEYFADGLADDLLTMLAKMRGLRVSARSSAFSFKGTAATVGEVGRRLRVATVLEGSVRKSGARVRISVQLVNVADESPMWSEVYDRTLDDIFAVQDDIAQSVVKELRATLLGADAVQFGGDVTAEVERAARGRGHDAEAHRLFLQGRALLGRFSREDATRAVAYLRQAVEREPSHALAWAEIARTLVLMAGMIWVPRDEAYEQARQAVTAALTLEPELPEAYVTLARIQLWGDWDWKGSTASVRRALEYAPDSPLVLRAASQHARMLGRLDEALELSRRATDQDPLYPPAHINLAFTLKAMRRYAEAETAYRMAMELAPLMAETRSHLALVLHAQGRGEEALAALRDEPEEICRLRSAAIIHRAMGHSAEASEALRVLVEKYADVAAYQIAQVHSAWGEPDATFDWLYRAIAQHDTGSFEVVTEEELDTARRDPRWGAFLAAFGYEA